LTLFFNDGKNLTSTGAHRDSPTTFFPIGTPERSTVTDLTGITGIKYVEVTRLDENLRKIKKFRLWLLTQLKLNKYKV
jgi:hypothetical protein